MPLFYLAVPANCGIFFSFAMQIAAFDIIPTDIIYIEWLGFNKPGALNNNLN